MCGIVGAVSLRDIVGVLVQGLERLEYRGYDSCGVAVYVQGADAAHSDLRRAPSTAVNWMSFAPRPRRRGGRHRRWMSNRTSI